MRGKTSHLINIMERINSFSLTKGLILKSEEVEEEDDNNFHDQASFKKLAQSNKISSHSRGFSPKSLMKENIKLGQTFKSFVEVSQAITLYEIQNGVHLTHKYFRRIAANPKPSNKDDFMLTEEERKRFVYRWVDFCCTYFDDMLTRTDHDDGDGNETVPVLGFAMKECPMRIRFQLRFNEKDLMISIFRETHDHNHPASEVPQMAGLPKKSGDCQPTATTTYAELGNSNCPRRPPPSLAPVPTCKVQRSLHLLSHSDSDLHGHSGITPLNLKLQMQFRNPAPIPKPPPLKAMPSLSCNNNTEMVETSSSKDHILGLSAESIIKNVYSYLRHLNADGSSCGNGLRFTSPKPDIIKITSELSGVEERKIMEICQTKRPHHMRTTGIKSNRNSSPTNAGSSPVPVRKVMKPSEEMRSKCSTSVKSNHFSVPFVNTSQNFSHQSFDDIDNDHTNFVDMPLEVIIKSEPGEIIDYYDENDSNSSTATNDDYARTNKPHAPR